MKRFWELDALRGIAILMMILFHLLWDLKYFGIINWSLYSGFWGYFQIATAGLFLLLAGMMVALSAQKYKNKHIMHLVKRGAIVFGFGILITIVSYFIFPDEFIYFGILHLIGFAIIVTIPIARTKLIPLIVGLLILILPFLINLQTFGINFLMFIGFAPPKAALDFVPVIPWISAFLFGIFLFNYLYKNGKRTFKLQEKTGAISKKLQFLGKHSLEVYLIHQPIIFGLVYVITLFFH